LVNSVKSKEEEVQSVRDDKEEVEIVNEVNVESNIETEIAKEEKLNAIDEQSNTVKNQEIENNVKDEIKNKEIEEDTKKDEGAGKEECNKDCRPDEVSNIKEDTKEMRSVIVHEDSNNYEDLDQGDIKKDNYVSEQFERKELKAKGSKNNTSKLNASSSHEIEASISSVQKECIEIIKNNLMEVEMSLGELLRDKIMIGKSEDGQEYEIVMIDDLMSLLRSISGKNLEAGQLAELEDLFRSSGGDKGNYVLIQTLAELFGDVEDEELLKEMNELSNDTFMVITGLINYLQENDVSVMELLSGAVHQQNVNIDDEVVAVELIDAKDFYEILKKIGILNEPDKDLSNFLCLDKKYPEVFLMKKFLKLVEHIALLLEQQDS